MLAIERNFPSNVKWCCNELLEEWLNTDINATWKKILQVIDSLNEGILVATIGSAPDISSQVPPGSYIVDCVCDHDLGLKTARKASYCT